MPPFAVRRAHAPLVLALAVALMGGACTGPRPELSSQVESTTTTNQGGDEPSEVAEAKAEAIDVYPDATSETPSRRITADEATSAPDVPLVFLVKERDDARIEVFLPTAPAGSTGWVRTEDVTLSKVTYRIEVELGAHRLRVFDEDGQVLDEAIAVGTADRPTPGTTYFLKELLQAPEPSGAYGRFAYVLSGATTSGDAFAAGSGIIGIHGTSNEESIGGDTATGSISLEDSALDRLVDRIGLPLGTPVTVLP